MRGLHDYHEGDELVDDGVVLAWTGTDHRVAAGRSRGREEWWQCSA